MSDKYFVATSFADHGTKATPPRPNLYHGVIRTHPYPGKLVWTCEHAHPMRDKGAIPCAVKELIERERREAQP